MHEAYKNCQFVSNFANSIVCCLFCVRMERAMGCPQKNEDYRGKILVMPNCEGNKLENLTKSSMIDSSNASTGNKSIVTDANNNSDAIADNDNSDITADDDNDVAADNDCDDATAGNDNSDSTVVYNSDINTARNSVAVVANNNRNNNNDATAGNDAATDNNDIIAANRSIPVIQGDNRNGYTEHVQKTDKAKVFWKDYVLPVATSITTFIIGGAITYFFTTNGSIATINSTLSSLNERIENVEKSIEGLDGNDGLYSKVAAMEESLEKLDDLPNKVSDIDNRLIVAETTLDFYVKLNVTGSEVENDKSLSVVANDISQTGASYDANTPIGVDDAGKKYLAEDLVDQAVLLTYSWNDGGEVYFFGQLNENYHWDGFCITNAYNDDGTLYGVCESNFDDGKRINYRSFYCSDEDANTWISTDRLITKYGNKGYTDQYEFEFNKVKDFNVKSVSESDILFIADLIEMCSSGKRSHYYGLTSEGLYNDITGSAYEIIYDNEGLIKTLYVGHFKDGKFHDQTGNAIEIVYDGLGYFCYTGTFTDGDRDGRVSGKDYVTQAQIDDILQGVDFDCELKWYTT